MILNNMALEEAVCVITSANGRETNVTLGGNLFNDVNLSEYQSPFSVQVTVGSTTEMINGVDESQCVSIYLSGTYHLSATSAL